MENNKKIKREKSKKLLPLYYMEGTYKVFTEEFHLRRGHCCGNGCQHCPYEPKYQKGNTSIKK